MNAQTPMDRAFAEIDTLLESSKSPHAARADREIGDYVLLADQNWKAAPFWLRFILPLAAWDRLTFDHIGYRFTIAQWRGQPYLIFADEVV